MFLTLQNETIKGGTLIFPSILKKTEDQVLEGWRQRREACRLPSESGSAAGGAVAFPLVRGAPSAPTARPGKRKGLIGLQLNNTFKRLHKKPRRAAAQIVEPAGLRALRAPGAKGEGAARPASDRWIPGSRGPRAGGDRTNIFPLGLSLFWAAGSWNRKCSVFHVRWPAAVLHLPASADELVDSAAFEVHHLLLKRSGSD